MSSSLTPAIESELKFWHPNRFGVRFAPNGFLRNCVRCTQIWM